MWICGIISWILQNSWREVFSGSFISYVMCVGSECMGWFLEFIRIMSGTLGLFWEIERNESFIFEKYSGSNLISLKTDNGTFLKTII